MDTFGVGGHLTKRFILAVYSAVARTSPFSSIRFSNSEVKFLYMAHT